MVPEDDMIDITSIKPVTVLQFLQSLRPALPMSTEKGCTPASGSEVRRWCEKKSVILNGASVGAQDIVTFPVTSLVLFPKGKSRCTLF